FFKKIQKEKPLVTIKIASSADGKISANLGEKTWVTGAEARRRGHLYRANHDAILVGIGTVLIDDPMLDCRIKGLEKRSPVRVLLDSNLRLSENSKFCKSAQKIPLWVMTCSNDQEKIKELENLGLRIFIIDKNDQGKLDLHHVMKVLSEQGITRVLSEGGGQVNASLIKASLVDRFIWFKSRENIGESGVNALYDISINQLDEHLNLSLINQGAAGADNWQEFEIIS
ncbi:MAG: RibD family protein, partial [Kordiimonadaceae bacterium]|nr:RibD family protein [Kordiimonadaceae bacterium]